MLIPPWMIEELEKEEREREERRPQLDIPEEEARRPDVPRPEHAAPNDGKDRGVIVVDISPEFDGVIPL